MMPLGAAEQAQIAGEPQDWRTTSPPDEATVAHELSHQWLGDAVTLRSWNDIWLQEGVATFAEWLWREHTRQKSVAQKFKELYSTRASDLSTRWVGSVVERSSAVRGRVVVGMAWTVMTSHASRERARCRQMPCCAWRERGEVMWIAALA